LLASVEKLDVQPHCVMALRLFEETAALETAALRDFDPAYARYRFAPKADRCLAKSVLLSAPRRGQYKKMTSAAKVN
jgi:hypothetical protein